jgi:RNA polymerase sigma factor (sigma-70 family)
MGRLSPKEKGVLVLRYYQGLSVAEIARVMGISEGTVKSLHFRGIRKMKKILSKPESELEL